ncbi:MAG: hypothetical protein ACERKD_02100 [Prolixibacteraceae bacterium]
MKTQLFTLIIIFVLSINVLALEAKTENSSPDQIPVGNFPIPNTDLEDESLTIEDWMTNDACWLKSDVSKMVDTKVEEEESLEIQPWMTNAKLWEANRKSTSNVTTVKVGDHYYHVYRITTEKEEPLKIEAWMTNDKLWNL